MISLPFRRLRRPPRVDALYGMIVAQARTPVFYRDYGVPDTVEGRLDMIVLHLVLVLQRLAKGHSGLPPLGQRLFDRFCRDIDDNFREMGVGDLTVPKEMRKVAEAFYGRSKAYEVALSTADPRALEEAVARNVFGASQASLGARRLAAYMRQAAQMLGGRDLEDPGQELQFPNPQGVPEPVLG